jgi:hypothetical protein
MGVEFGAGASGAEPERTRVDAAVRKATELEPGAETQVEMKSRREGCGHEKVKDQSREAIHGELLPNILEAVAVRLRAPKGAYHDFTGISRTPSLL